MTERTAPRRFLSLLAVLALALAACVSDGKPEPSEEEREKARDPFKELFEKARDNPNDHELQATLGWAYYFDKRDFNRARVHYERAIQLAGERKFTGYHYVLGIIHWEMGQFDDALHQMDQTYLVPQEPGRTYREDNYYRQSQWLAARIFAENKKDPEKALEHIQRFHDLGGSLNLQTEVYEAITRNFLERKDIASAETSLEKFKALKGDAGEVWQLERQLRKLKEEAEKEKADSGGESAEGPASIGPRDAQ